MPKICIHAGECVRGLPSVFNVSEKPWIDVNGACANAIAEQVKQCPSGALSYESLKKADSTPVRVCCFAWCSSLRRHCCKSRRRPTRYPKAKEKKAVLNTPLIAMSKEEMKKDTAECMKHIDEAHKAMGL